MSAQIRPIEAGLSADPHVFLVGRPPLGEFLSFVTAQSVGGAEADMTALTAQWRGANDHVNALQAAEAGFADSMATTPVPEALRALADQVAVDPVVQRTFAFVPYEIAMVELDRLVVFQKKINLSHVERLAAELGSDPTDENVFNLCLPTASTRNDPPVGSATIGPNAFGFVSSSNDFRVLGARLIEGAELDHVSFNGIPAKIVAVAVGYGANLFSAIRANGRLVLNNGSHRAYALRKAGVRVAPCLIQNVSRPDELPMVASGDFAANPDAYLGVARPPVLKDYFDDRLRIVADVPRVARQVRVIFQDEAIDAPVAL